MLNLFKKKSKSVEVLAPLTGTTLSIEEVPDPVFSEKMMGEGIAIKPTTDTVVAPFKGTVKMLMPNSGHAVGLLSEDGLEILIHVGMDTVELQGKYFKPHVKAGDRVKTGDMLLTFDKEAIEKEGYETVTPVIVSNSTNHTAVCKGEPGMIKAGDLIMTVE